MYINLPFSIETAEDLIEICFALKELFRLGFISDEVFVSACDKLASICSDLQSDVPWFD